MTTGVKVVENDLTDVNDSWWPSWLRWLPTSKEKQAEAEKRILQRLQCRVEEFFLPIFDSTLFLRTIIARNYPSQSPDAQNHWRLHPEQNTPMVLIHGFASGLGLWCKNIDSLSECRRVYAFDLLGFGRSSRPDFPDTAEEVERKFVEVIEEWRKNMQLDNFILIGHSMGGFLSAAYALEHPERVKHLILADPWGFVGQTDSTSPPKVTGFRAWLLGKLTNFRALSTMRLIGPLGPKAFRTVRQDFEHVFFQIPRIGEEMEILHPNDSDTEDCGADFGQPAELSSSPPRPWSPDSVGRKSPEPRHHSPKSDFVSPFDPSVVYDYIYHINVRHPSGEDAFMRLSQRMGWAARPMLPRITQLSSSVPITFIYGGRSWVDMSSGLRVRANRPQSYVDVMVIEGGGHHAYAQYADEFNDYVNAVARLVDEGYEFRPGSEDLVQVEQPRSSIYRPRAGSYRAAEESPEDSQDSALPKLHHRPKRRSLASSTQIYQTSAGDKDGLPPPTTDDNAPQQCHRSSGLPPRPPLPVTSGETSA